MPNRMMVKREDVGPVNNGALARLVIGNTSDYVFFEEGCIIDDGLNVEVQAHLIPDSFSLPTATPVNAEASTFTTSLTGTNNDLVFTAATKGVSGDDISVTYLNSLIPSNPLSVSVVGGNIIVDLETDAGGVASADIGGGANGMVTVAYEVAGAVPATTVEVVFGSGNDVPLSANVVSNAITVTLGTDGAGDPDETKNTATLVADVISALANFTGTASGNGSTALTTPEGPTALTGGVDPAIVTIASDIVAEIEATPEADALVSVTNADGNDGTGLVTELAETPLVNGVNGTAGEPGQIVYDASYCYICISAQTIADSNWRRASLSSF